MSPQSENQPLFPRSSGVLLHPTCLPGPDGIGDLGEPAYRFVDWLEKCGQSLWQILPLGPTSFGDSPYQTLSAFAGNPLLVSLDRLEREGWLLRDDLAGRPKFDEQRVDFGPVITWKTKMLDRAWSVFLERASQAHWNAFDGWCAEQVWLDDFALFMALKEDQEGRPWTEWPADLAGRRPDALAEAARRLDKRIAAHKFRQWLFFHQWSELKAFAMARGIRLVGDLPIFVAHDSSDVWSRSELFQLDAKGLPTSVAGVPPDYFSKTGQLWGNPLYDWDRLKDEDYRWWVDRVRVCLETVDLVRIDHFRGFEAYWEVPADEKTAVNGTWVSGPGEDFFSTLSRELGGTLPVIAEDLGVITPAVEQLRDAFDLPGMKVLQFAWSGPDNVFLPHEHVRNCVVYSGTHDNDPTIGWWNHLADSASKELVAEYTGCDIDEPHWALIRLGMMSPAHTFIATMQDVLGLGREARMNLPGEGKGNWNWRMSGDVFLDEAGDRLARFTWLYRRRPDQAGPHREDPTPPAEGQFA
ncbi:MAG: 4-alpha-glucanotransferase [Candidatus Krumholzibacteriota bacterium]